MVQPKQLKDVSKKAVRLTQVTIEQTIREIPQRSLDSVVSTARIIISAEERLRQRLRSVLRVTVATLFLGISGLISLGANVTMAFAKKVSPETTREKRTRGNLKAKYHLRTSGKSLEIATRGKHGLKASFHGTSLKATHMKGVASWYGKQFNNRKTASGVRFNTHAMMAAHRTLPFGTKVRVTNLKNHKSCIVEITDRGPYVGNRVIDVSYAAAQSLGMASSGTAEVRLEVLGRNGDAIVGSPDIATDASETAVERQRPVFDGIPTISNRQLASILNAPVAVEHDDR
jgi:rare lipoprotein A (peptidoglycan hydrolase)